MLSFKIPSFQKIAFTLFLVFSNFAPTAVSGTAASATAVSVITETASKKTSHPLASHDLIPSSQPKRIISLTPNVTEFLFAAGMGEQLVGVSDYSDYPEKAKSIPRIADASGINLEQIVALQPDWVVTWQGFTSSQSLAQLNALDIPVTVLSAKTLSELVDVLLLLQSFSENPEQANHSYEQLLAKLTQLKNEKSLPTKAHKPRVLALFSTEPFITSNQNTLQGQVIELCGGENIFAEASPNWPQLNLEAIIAQSPEVIILPQEPDTNSAVQSSNLQRLIAFLPNIKTISVNADLFSRESPRLLDAATEICNALIK